MSNYNRSVPIIFFILLTGLLLFIASLIIGKNKFLPTYHLLEEKQSEEMTAITFMTSWAGGDTKTSKINDILRAFEEEHTDIKVLNRSVRGADFLYTLKTYFASGNDPDIFGLWPGSDIRILIKADKISELNEYLEQDEAWAQKFREETWQFTTYDNKIYGLPVEIIFEGIFINKDLFKEYNVELPKDKASLLSAVKTFRKHNIIPFAYNATPEGSFLYQNIVMSLGGKNAVENPITHEKVQTCFIEGMHLMKELYDLGAFPEQYYKIDNDTRNKLFIDKKAAMIVQGSWFLGEGAVAENDTSVGIIPFPKLSSNIKENTIIYGIGNGNFHMTKQVEQTEGKKEACVKLLKYLTTESSANTLLCNRSYISNIHINNPMPLSYLGECGKNLIDEAPELIGPVDNFIDRSVWENIIVQSFPMVYEGAVEPEEIFEKVETFYSNKHRRGQ